MTKTPRAEPSRKGMEERTPATLPGWEDPKCPKCGIVLANRMSYLCQHSYCPSGLN